ncbi:prolyl oligopeptidase family serine peptidase [Mobilicoccus caccae]|uniref:prolyl oligopeptidase n=1 Tax=Mobilicoccus caccae TaxID=1859295 RepID=A0ABQ6ISF2_9MICO|nr:prolyl oligopeptidase family serine peptidase [Mobilicoccus caccae]GMA40371.1 prolyl endopeptidase [Mobilicoccus caccae]
MEIPQSRRGDVVETLHGRRIADPYRWLEDPDSPETRAWVSAQNAVTRVHLEGLASHTWFSDLLRRIVMRPVATPPFHCAGWYVVSRGDGSGPQNTWYIARTLAELEAGGDVLFEPSTWSSDGTTSISGLSVSRDGALAAYSRSAGGSDWQQVYVQDLHTGRAVEEAVLDTKFSDLIWLGDDRTFLYTRYVDSRAEGTATAALPRPILMSHEVGSDPADDALVLEFPDDPRVSMWPSVSSDGRWLAISMNRGTEDRYKLWLYPLRGADLSEPVKVLDDFTDDVGVVDVVDDILYLVTDRDAPRSRVVSFDLSSDGAAFSTVVPESDSTLVRAVITGDVMVTEHLEDAAPVLTRWTRGGDELGRLPIIGGTVLVLDGEAGRDELLVTVNSVTSPAQSFVVTPSNGQVRELSFIPGESWTPPEVRVTRHRATSDDGTRVPYWLIRSADTEGSVPTLMYGYGGFNVPLGASYSPMNIAWVQAGGAVAIANLRGGGEFGTEWYEQGKLQHKQNVFDDFAAVARHLVDEGVTSRAQLAAYGGSNGGLLVGALITQHPDLVAAAAPMVGVLDLLRFHRFTIGSSWISDYGDPDVAEDFEVALAYSPLHNVREGTAYPATIVVTGDHDDRVVPAHSHKFTATLQHAQAGGAPVLTRIETSTGHGAGKPKPVQAQEAADVLAFLAAHTGLDPDTASR